MTVADLSMLLILIQDIHWVAKAEQHSYTKVIRMSPTYNSWESFLLVAINNKPDNLAWIQSAVQNFMQVVGRKLFCRLQALLWDEKINEQHLTLSEFKRKMSSNSPWWCFFIVLIFRDWCRFQKLGEKYIIKGLPENNHWLLIQREEDNEKCTFIYIILYKRNIHISLATNKAIMYDICYMHYLQCIFPCKYKYTGGMFWMDTW